MRGGAINQKALKSILDEVFARVRKATPAAFDEAVAKEETAGNLRRADGFRSVRYRRIPS